MATAPRGWAPPLFMAAVHFGRWVDDRVRAGGGRLAARDEGRALLLREPLVRESERTGRHAAHPIASAHSSRIPSIEPRESQHAAAVHPLNGLALARALAGRHRSCRARTWSSAFARRLRQRRAIRVPVRLLHCGSHDLRGLFPGRAGRARAAGTAYRAHELAKLESAHVIDYYVVQLNLIALDAADGALPASIRRLDALGELGTLAEPHRTQLR